MAEKQTIGELVYKISGDMQELQTAVKKSQSEIEKLQKGSEETSESIKKMDSSAKVLGNTLKAVVGYFSASAVLGFFKQSMAEVEEYDVTLTKLSNTLKNSNGEGQKQVQMLLDQAEALGKIGVIQKETITAAQAHLATFDLTSESIATLTPAVLDYVVAEKGANATRQDAQQLSNSLAQAIQGNFGNLQQAGFILDEHTKKLISQGTEEERVAAITEVLNSTYAGLNQKTRESMGVTADLRDVMSEIREVVGRDVKNAIEVTSPVVKFFSDNIYLLVDGFKNLVISIGVLKFVGFIQGVNLASIATARLTAAVNLLRTSLGALSLLVGVVTVAATLIQNAAKKAGDAWDEAADAAIKTADANVALIKKQRREVEAATKTGNKDLIELAKAQQAHFSAIVQGQTQEELAELAKRRNAAREKVFADKDLTAEWEKVITDANEVVKQSSLDLADAEAKLLAEKEKAEKEAKKSAQEMAKEMAKEMEKAEKEAKKSAQEMAKELENVQGKMLDLLDASKKASASLREDFSKALAETTEGLAEIAIKAEDKVKDLKKRIRDEENDDRRRELQDELKQQEEILKAREGFEERRAERLVAIRTRLEEAGIATDDIDNLLEVQSLEDQIREERRLADMDEFSRFEEQQFLKLEKIVDDIITRRQMETELTEFLKSQDADRLESVQGFADQAIAKYGEMAASLRSAISLQAQLNAMRSNPRQFHTGGMVGASGGEVHAGEYVIPANMVARMGGLISSLESSRRSGGSIDNSRTVNAPITMNNNVEGMADFNAFSKSLAWELKNL